MASDMDSALMFFILGLLSKENTVILPAVFVLAEIAFFKPGMKELFGTGICLFCYNAGLAVWLVLSSASPRRIRTGTGYLGNGQVLPQRSRPAFEINSPYAMSYAVLLPLHYYLATAVSCSTHQSTSSVRRLMGPAGEPLGASRGFGLARLVYPVTVNKAHLGFRCLVFYRWSLA